MEVSKLIVKGWQPIPKPSASFVNNYLKCHVNKKLSDCVVMLTYGGVKRSNPNVKQLILPKNLCRAPQGEFVKLA